MSCALESLESEAQLLPYALDSREPKAQLRNYGRGHLEARFGLPWHPCGALEVIFGCLGAPFGVPNTGSKPFARAAGAFGASFLGAQGALEAFLELFLIVFEGSRLILGWISR